MSLFLIKFVSVVGCALFISYLIHIYYHHLFHTIIIIASVGKNAFNKEMISPSSHCWRTSVSFVSKTKHSSLPYSISVRTGTKRFCQDVVNTWIFEDISCFVKKNFVKKRTFPTKYERQFIPNLTLHLYYMFFIVQQLSDDEDFELLISIQTHTLSLTLPH